MENKVNKKYKLLIIGNIYDNHIIRFIRNLKRENPLAQIDTFTLYLDKEIPKDITLNVNNIYGIKEKKYYFRSITIIARILELRKYFSVLTNTNYDIINIHFPVYIYAFILKNIRKITDTLLITPWGSDVYRTHGISRYIVRHIYNKATYVCGTGNKFNMDTIRIFNIPNTKIVNLDIGSETIDYISAHKNEISAEGAKEKLNVAGKYVIACGYNASKAQNHKIIISAIAKIKESLPKDLILFFPLTYGGNKEYINLLKKELDAEKLSYRFFETYLQLDELFLLRQATDMFIHIQTTDANSATLQEYILCNKKVINGSWLRYKELEKDSIVPYFLVDDVNHLDDVILKTYKAKQINVPEITISYIKSYGWREWIVKWDKFFSSCTK